MRHLSDEQLVVLYAAGDNSAFDTIITRHQNRLFNYIYYIVKQQDLAEDIFQETFIKAIVTIQNGRYTDTGKFAAWLTRIAHNLIIDYYRQEKNIQKISNSDYEQDIFNNLDLAESTIEEEWIAHQTFEEIKEFVDALPENQREVILMRFYKDMSFKEIAEATDVSINTALGRMRYAVMNMRKMAQDSSEAIFS